jgi:hypothetical protein
MAGDAEILRYVAAHGLPAERCAADEPVSALDGRAVLVTEWADAVPRGTGPRGITDEGLRDRPGPRAQPSGSRPRVDHL